MIPVKKLINISFIAELLVVCGLAVSFYGLYNYSLDEPTWSFNLWLIIDMIGLTIAGGVLTYSFHIKDAKRAILLLNIQTIIVSLGLIMWGIEAIHKKHIIVNLEHFIGADADLIGKFSIGIGILGIIWSLFTKAPLKSPTSHSEVMICVNCLKPYSKQSVEISSCPKCGGVLEALKGFYERHPDKQDTNLGNDMGKSLVQGKNIKEFFRALFLIIFLALIVLYAFWQSFIVHGFK
jgi:hypothetical protein